MKVIQVGTCVGNDDLTELLKGQQPEILILVEPMEVHNNNILECYKCYDNIHIENIAITADNNDEISFFYHSEDTPRFELASTSIDHILKHRYWNGSEWGQFKSDGIIETKVKCLTLNQLFDKYKIKNLDILFLDAEGLDDELIKSIDFTKFNIEKIFFENLHIKDEGVYDFLKNLGYKITHNIGHNGWSTLAEKEQFILKIGHTEIKTTTKQENIKIGEDEYASLRFYPYWDPTDSNQITGLIRLIIDICELGQNLKGIEIGSYIGESSLIFMSFPDIQKLICIDPGLSKLFYNKLDKFIKNNNCIPMKMLSSDANKKIIEDDFDFIYIDGDHSYDYVKEDIEIWYPKVRAGGLICGHDYNNQWEGVVQAVDEFVERYSLKLKIYEDCSWSVIKK
jgi:FkbM family methyltransferase